MVEIRDNAQALAWIRAVLATTPSRVTTLFETLPEELLRARPEPGEWSAVGCLVHLHATEMFVFSARVRAFLAAEDITAYDPATEDHDNVESPSALAAEFALRRAESLILFDTVGPEDFDRVAIHEELGEVRLGHLLHEWALHDLNHLIQMERAIMQPFLPGVGPWRFYFADHDVAAKKPLVE